MGRTEEEHNENLNKVMERAKKLNVKFYIEKLQYKVKEVGFLGHIFSELGVQADSKRIKAIVHMPKPSSKKELQRFLGMVNYMRSFIPNMAEVTELLRQLLRIDNEFLWFPIHTETVNKLKGILTRETVLHPFANEKKIIIQTDSSKSGVGCVLLQEGKPISYASRSLTDTEINYAQVEKEMLAIIYSCEKFHNFIYARPVEIHTDHKPLVNIMKKELNKIKSSRLQRMRLKLLIYNLNVKHVPGKEMHVADHLSRSYLTNENADEFKEYNEVVHSINMSDEKLKIFKQETLKDPILSKLLETYKEGWPNNKAKVDQKINQFWKFKENICCEDNIVFFNERVMVPLSLRAEMLKKLHEAHIGITKTKLRARGIIYWPGIDSDIEENIMKCKICQNFLQTTYMNH